jgi:hypothetical protein
MYNMYSNYYMLGKELYLRGKEDAYNCLFSPFWGSIWHLLDSTVSEDAGIEPIGG